MKTFALVIVGLALVGGAYWAGNRRCPHDYFCISESSGDPSPIIITDGSSIHFAQNDQWTYEGKYPDKLFHISALLPTHRVKWLEAKLCPTPLAYNTCSRPVLSRTGVMGKSWTLYLCQDSASCTPNGASATVSLNKDIDFPQHSGDKGLDMVVTSRTNFMTEDDSANGKMLYLPAVQLKWAHLIITNANNTTTESDADCSGSTPANPSGPVCVVKICYATAIQDCT